MKLSNFTSLDSAEAARGIAGLSGASNADRAIWKEFEGNTNELASESEEALETFGIIQIPKNANEAQESPSGPTEVIALTKVRRQQRFFRRAVLSSYGNRCCITGNPIPELIRASHIVPWAESEEHRTNPRNGLCLAATFDAAFDRGLISIDDEFRVILSSRFREFLPNSELERTFCESEGKAIELPAKNLPDAALLTMHRTSFGFQI